MHELSAIRQLEAPLAAPQVGHAVAAARHDDATPDPSPPGQGPYWRHGLATKELEPAHGSVLSGDRATDTVRHRPLCLSREDDIKHFVNSLPIAVAAYREIFNSHARRRNEGLETFGMHSILDANRRVRLRKWNHVKSSARKLTTPICSSS